jgi:glutamate-5-semialdehyde dehydrogenase
MITMVEIGRRAGVAARQIANITTEQKNKTLIILADSLLACSDEILAANEKDVSQGRANNLSEALIDRLLLNPSRLAGIASDLKGLVELKDPVGEVFEEAILPNGLQVHKQRVPLGVLGIIYEARPNVTMDIAGLAIKTSNAAILRGGKETIHSNRALVEVIRSVLNSGGLPEDTVQFIDDPDRARVAELLQMDEYVNMIIPRGGATLHEYCRKNSSIPVITGGIGICHLFVDETADLGAALQVIRNAKIQRPSVCNALDTALVHRNIAASFLPILVDTLAKDGVTFRADESTIPFLNIGSDGADQLSGVVLPAGPNDFDTEWLSLILGLKVVSGIDEAIEHIRNHSTHHSDGILTQSEANANLFIQHVDSAAVYVNASTRFTDGSQLGLGAEVAISTQRLHARGPMGLRELTTYKWVIHGNYHIRK